MSQLAVGETGRSAQCSVSAQPSAERVLRRVEFWFPVLPVAKARPRVTWRRGGRHAYTPTATASAEKAIRTQAESMLGSNWRPLSGPLRLTVVVARAEPKTLPRDQRLTRVPTQRPDLDNYQKLITDALSPCKSHSWGVWHDDAQIVEVSGRKEYAGNCGVGWKVIAEEVENHGLL
ncbi:MAG TPA: RusA family crossover junction endodeoxyribonuclease [Acidimicrobiales bacterium]|nr:RusA family crossover junction endodeoxyribonuclease [Acidimicrobiales bacterium]